MRGTSSGTPCPVSTMQHWPHCSVNFKGGFTALSKLPLRLQAFVEAVHAGDIFWHAVPRQHHAARAPSFCEFQWWMHCTQRLATAPAGVRGGGACGGHFLACNAPSAPCSTCFSA